MLMGAQELVNQGIMSSLQPANMRLARAVINHESASKHEAYPLLFDPQVSPVNCQMLFHNVYQEIFCGASAIVFVVGTSQDLILMFR